MAERDAYDTPESRIRLIPFGEITLGTRRRDLVQGLIPRVGLVVVWGPPKSGKSFWVFDLAMHVTLDWPYRGRRVHPGPVIYCAFEGQAGIEARAAAFRQRFLAEEPAAIPFYLEPVSLDLVADHRELIAAVRQHLAHLEPVAVVLDTLNRSLRGSESSDEDMTAYVRAADAIREAFECVVIVVHHCGVDDGRPRGHTSLSGAADAQLSVKRDAEGNIAVEVELAKDGRQGDSLLSCLEVVEVGLDEDGETITSCVIVPAEGEFSSPAKRLSGVTKTAFELLQKAIDEAGEPAPGGPHFPPGARTIGVSAWRAYHETGTIADGAKPDSRRRAFVRAIEKLQAIGVIGVWADRVWINETSRTSRT
ncbi:MAG TPA: AAA family ATPase [Caulobacteraceae bacterium]|jgi:hypothetical protein